MSPRPALAADDAHFRAHLRAQVGMLAEHVRQLVEALSRPDQDGADMRASEGKLAVVESLVAKLRQRQTDLVPAGAGAG